MFPRAAAVLLVVLLVGIATVAVVAAVRLKRIIDVAKCEISDDATGRNL